MLCPSVLYPPNVAALLILLIAPLLGAASVQADSRSIDIDHALGTATVTGTPTRVVSLYQGATDSLAALGIKPVGMVESWVEKPVYRYLRGYLGEPRLLGMETQPDLEGVAWLQPDLIIGARYRHYDVYPLLDQIAPTLIAEDVYDFRALLTMIAEATGTQHQSTALLTRWDERARDFRHQISDKLGERWPVKVAILSFRGDHARIYYNGFAKQVLEELGFSALKAHQKDSWGIKLTSQESIPAMDAEAIFYFMDDNPAAQRTYDTWTSHPLWQNLTAVRRGQVFRVDQVTWNMGAGILAADRMLDDLYHHYDLDNPLAGECSEC